MDANRCARMLLSAVLVFPVVLTGCEGAEEPRAADLSALDHAAALTRANDFLQAWRKQDLSSALNMLSDRLRRAHTLTQIEDAVRGHPNVKHAAFTIDKGEPMGQDRMVFRVRLVFRFTGQAEDRVESSSHRMVLALDDRGDWRVDEFPIPRN